MTPQPQQALPLCCRNEGKADCEYMVWDNINGHTLCTRNPTHPTQNPGEPTHEFTLRELHERDNAMRNAGAAQAREKVLKLAADEWGMLAAVKKENTDEFMEYLTLRIEEFGRTYYSLRREAQR